MPGRSPSNLLKALELLSKQHQLTPPASPNSGQLDTMASAAFQAFPSPFTGLPLRSPGPRAVCRARTRCCAAPQPPGVRLEDREVPSGHLGLHAYLYEGGDAEHAAERAEARGPRFQSGGERVFPLEVFLRGVTGERVAGVYAVHDAAGTVLYVGMGRDVGRELGGLRERLGPRCDGVRIQTWDFPKREEMAVLRDEWMRTEGGGPPVGNGEEREVWEEARRAWMKGEEKEKWREKKDKLRMAMADMTLVDELEQMDKEGREEEAALRRSNMKKAMEEDDWSGEIDRQTAETMPMSEGRIVSPFEGQDAVSVGQAPLDGSVESLPLTVENVDVVLDEVRPYLLSDGGNVSVLSVEDNNVKLQLEGACGTCAASTATMKLGIERALREKFKDLGEVVAVSESESPKEMSVQLVESILDEVRPAVEGLGGKFKVLEVEDGVVKLEFGGSEKLVYGIELMLKDKLPEMRSLEVVQP